MGSLKLPASGFVYFDTNAFIYSVEKIPPYATLLEPVWQAAHTGTLTIISSEFVLLETLVGPLKNADTVLEASFRALLLASYEVELFPVSMVVLERAAHLRATTNIKAPDAIHAATGLNASCATFITNDNGYRRVAGLPVQILNEVAALPSD